MNEDERLRKRVEAQANRMKEAEKHKETWFANTAFLGTLGIMLVLPVIIGAYLGSWLDKQLSGFSVGWTTSLVIVGVFIGGMNVYLFIRRGD